MVRPDHQAIWLLLCLIVPGATSLASEHSSLDDKTFAVVNGERLSAVLYLSALNSGIRQRFYHGNVPAAQMAAFKQEVADKVVDSMLLLQEAKRQGVVADQQAVTQQLDNYEKRYGESPEWRARRDKLLPELRAQLENQSILKRITARLKQTPQPEDQAIRRYYHDHPDKFTTPQKRKVSLILLKVAPSSPRSVWDKARSDAADLIERIKAGQSFSELAKIHSADEQSARNGGDMGYLHRGMLAEEAEAVLDKLSVGALSEPVTTLHGVVVLRLDDITEARLNPYEKVRERAAALLHRERAEQQYQQALTALHQGASIEVNTKLITQDK